MEQHINKALQQMAKSLQMTPFDLEPEEYILTKEEEADAVKQVIGHKKNQYVAKWLNRGMTIEEVEQKLVGMDLEGEIDKQELFKRVNSHKLYKKWEIEQREKEKNEKAEKRKALKELWTANRFFKMMKFVCENDFQKPLLVNDHTMQIIKPLCYFLSEDSRFETELGYSLSKGIVFRGISGLGKTFIAKLVSANELHSIFMISMIEISESVKSEGEYALPMEQYSKMYIDDVGSEDASVVNHYGTKINWFKNFLEIFYLRSQQYNRIILSTNISFAQFEEKYGFRVRSRMKDMFNIIDVSGKDLRG